MASTVDQGGYDVNFTSEIPDELRCQICQLVLREPVQIMTCGHRFCGICFERMRDHAQKTNIDLLCPMDRQVVNPGQVFPDKAAHRTISNLKVQCGNHDKGCPWVDDLQNLQNHEEKCEFQTAGGLYDMLIANKRHEQLNILIQQIMSRLLSCENNLLEKDKELSHLNVTVSKLKEYNKLKDEEILMLKSSSVELKRELTNRDKDVRQLKESIDMIQNDIETIKTPANESKEDIYAVMEDEMNKELKEKSETQNQMSKIEEQTMKTKEQIQNIENVLFAHKKLQETNEVSLLWVMDDFSNKFEIREPVLSPLFHTKVCGYSFRLYVDWMGENKENLCLFLRLHRGETPHNLLGEFNHEFTLTFHGKKGKKKTYRCSHADIKKYKDRAFMIKEGRDWADESFSEGHLTAPYDNYIINNSLLTSCTFHF